MVTIEDVRALASTLPRSDEVLVRDRVKFRVGQIVFLAFSRDETEMGFGFPKEEREALVAAEPEGQRPAGFTTEGAAEAVHVKTFGLGQVADGKRQMEDDPVHPEGR